MGQTAELRLYNNLSQIPPIPSFTRHIPPKHNVIISQTYTAIWVE